MKTNVNMRDFSFTDEEEKLTLELVNRILKDATDEHASDIHFNPARTETIVKFRIDGVMREISRHSPKAGDAIIRMIKKLAALDPDLTEIPQDGKILTTIPSDKDKPKRFDMRVSTIPSYFGENLVIRVLDTAGVESVLKGGFEVLGLFPEDVEQIKKILDSPFGMVFFTGPTGSGKTTTLYSGLSYLVNSCQGKASIMSLEEPIEFLIDGIIQTQVRSDSEFNYMRGIKAVLRQDLDILFCGEVTDAETMMLLLQVALTGHLVLTQLHSTDVAHALKTLVEIGVEPYLLGLATVAVISQRLTRKICPACKTKVKNNINQFARFHDIFDIQQLEYTYRGTGCEQCKGSGYKGRTAVYEIVKGGEKIADLLSKNLSLVDLRKELAQMGNTTLQQSAFKLAVEGYTTIEEALRCTRTP